jgi:protein phosphatase
MKFAVKSDRGIVREINEDNYNIIAGYSGVPISFLIADGMGGHNSGEIASKMAVDIVSSYLLQFPKDLTDEKEICSFIEKIITKANQEIFIASKEEETYFGMGTTLIVTLVYNNKLFIGHVGDSRVYLLRDGEMLQLTIDHSYVEELIKNGTLTREEAENHPKKNVITRALGCAEDIEIDTYSEKMKNDDVFIICTDGLTNMISEDEIKEAIESSRDIEAACEILVNRAIEKGGEDNITVIVFREDSLI